MSDNGAFSPEGLDGLLSQSEDARKFFNTLPEYAREMILSRRQSIQSEDELRRYADNITQGD